MITIGVRVAERRTASNRKGKTAMIAGRRLRTKVQPGGRIEVVATEFPVGEVVEVTIQAVADEADKPSILEVLAECPGGVLFKTAEEVDAYIREERDSWDR
jgi:hypothetical protein